MDEGTSNESHKENPPLTTDHLQDVPTDALIYTSKVDLLQG